MKGKLWVSIAAVAAVVVLGLVAWSLGNGTPSARAQSTTGTPRPGIGSAATITSTAAPQATSAAASSAITNTALGTAPTASAGTITVVGEGQVTIKPDIARLNIGVESVQPTVKEASTQTKTAMDAVMKALKAQGLADKDIQTSNYSIYAERSGPVDTKNSTSQVMYHVSNQVQITIRDLNQVSNVLDAAIEAGANNVYGVTFSVEDPTKVEAQGRQAAVSDALRRARDLARLSGVELGGVVSVSEVVGNQGGSVANSFRDSLMAKGAGGGGPISPGELELTMQLQVTYAIK